MVNTSSWSGRPRTGLQQADSFWYGYLCLLPLRNISYRDTGGFCLFFKSKRKKREKEASKPTTQALWMLLPFSSSAFEMFICINIARNMGTWFMLANSSSCAMTDMFEGKQAGFSLPHPSPLEANIARKKCWTGWHQNDKWHAWISNIALLGSRGQEWPCREAEWRWAQLCPAVCKMIMCLARNSNTQTAHLLTQAATLL